MSEDQSSLEKEVFCSRCKEKITTGDFVLVGEQNYHVDHFLCFHCNNPLGGKLYYEHGENVYCEDDYHNLFSPKCDKCEKPIRDKYLNVMNKNFHQDCFVCHECGSVFEKGQYFKHEDHPICLKCYSAKAKRCAQCSEPILSKVYSALDQYWHLECFKCSKCGENFKNESFITMEGKPFHQKCCEILCVQCQKPVSGEYYQVEGTKALHKDCLAAYKEAKTKEAQAQAQIKKPEPPKQENIPNEPKPEEQKPQPPKEEPKPEPPKEEPKPEPPKEEPKPEPIKVDLPKLEKKEEIPQPPKEEHKIEEKPKPLEKAVLLEEKQASPIKKPGGGGLLGVPAQDANKKRSSVLVNASNYEVFVPEFEEKKAETLQEGFNSHSATNVYPYDLLTKPPFPADVDINRKEDYLGEADFKKVFGMNKPEFEKLPKWKKTEMKKKAKLF